MDLNAITGDASIGAALVLPSGKAESLIVRE